MGKTERHPESQMNWIDYDFSFCDEPIIVFTDKQGRQHLERDYRVVNSEDEVVNDVVRFAGRIFEADYENPMGHEGRLYHGERLDPLE